jgi:hypothetical protein
MRKFIFLLLLVASISIYVGCVKGNQTYGPAGPAGPAGNAGSNPGAITFSLELKNFNGIAPRQYVLFQPLTSKNTTYMLTAYVASDNSPSIWNKLPYFNVITPGDELCASYGEDTVQIWYYSNSAWNTDSVFNCQVIMVPISNSQ